MKLSSIAEGKFHTSGLYKTIYGLRDLIAREAMGVYDNWDNDEDKNGICDEIAFVIESILSDNGINSTDYGHDGDNHASVVAYDDSEAFLIDIPYHTYESGGGYNWHKLPNITITPDDVVIVSVDRPDWIDNE